MRILAVDIGTGTQDILLYDSEVELENCVQMIMPSPTQTVAARIRQATATLQGVLLTGVTMGGGPCAWAAEAHLARGLALYATPEAARTFDDDLDRVADMGVTVVGEDQARDLVGLESIELRDFDYAGIQAALQAFAIPLDLDAIAVGVFDHGDAPPGVSDRAFRFEHLAATVKANDLTAFAYRRDEIPARMTRMQAVAGTVPADRPLVVMDTGPAAVLGALQDRPALAASLIIVNIGNMHTLAFHIADDRILGIFEHHTGELSREALEMYLRKLGEGSLTNAEVFADKGHGALVVPRSAAHCRPEKVVVVGPRRSLLAGSPLQPYFAVPHGSMMLAGCYGLLEAVARKWPEWAETIERSLGTRQ